MNELLERCAGLDVHQRTIKACIMIGFGSQVKKKIKTFGTTTKQIYKLDEWMKSYDIKDAAMESTGIYWQPPYNILEKNFKITIANPWHMKNIPGKKTDVKDAEWICQLLKFGLLKSSFIPPKDIRDLRNLTRQRRKYTEQKTSSLNRIIKTLESRNIKLKSVVSSIESKSSWNVVKAISNGQTDPDELMALMVTKIKASKEEIKEALTGIVTSHEMMILKSLIRDVDHYNSQIEQVDIEINKAQENYKKEIELIKTFPGVGEISASVVISEIGTNMNQFPSENHLASWAGLAPGNNESANKIKSSRILPGNKNLKVSLIQVSWAAVREKDGYWRSIYYRLRSRLGAKKAIIAIARRILTKIYFSLKLNTNYQGLGLKEASSNIKKSIDYYQKKLNKLIEQSAIS